ncbi:MAG TPA: arginyltransferase [Sneathiellales bacterium]|jgi:arginine-tRNA-protein transferase|nr:arginyltransferase [Sneathiellales bacterium]
MTKNLAHIPLEFFLTAPAPCPYMPDRIERRIFTELDGYNSTVMSHSLNLSGFRRSQTISYRPVCDECNACISIRVDAEMFAPTQSMKRVRKRNADIVRKEVSALATVEHFTLFREYVNTRHGNGGMEKMDFEDYSVMVGAGTTKSCLVEYRINKGDRAGELVAVCLTDEMYDGLSLVYSFFAPLHRRRSLGHFVILDHLKDARARKLPFVYLGYWIKESTKMSYKARFQPCQGFIQDRWVPLNARTYIPQEPAPKPWFSDT